MLYVHRVDPARRLLSDSTEEQTMYFLLSKTLGALLTPTTFITALGLAGLALLCLRLGRWGRVLVTASVVLLVIGALTPIGYFLLAPLENRFPVWNASEGRPTGVVILGGSIDPDLSAGRGFAIAPVAADRLIAAAELARRFPDIPIIFTGGSAGLFSHEAKEADYANDYFERLGLPKDRVILERASRNTMENASFTKAIAKPKPSDHWLLVTSAFHMPRSVGLFRDAGFAVEAYPVDWLTPGRPIWIDRPLEALRRTDIACREWMGLIADWILGKSEQLFPSPRTTEKQSK
jgi:uncharacterized SAM-binding protein YcdF (DUF218 family)